jgi:hypothetical protein
MEKLFNVYIKSGGGTKVIIINAVPRHEAHSFCADNHWEWCDENDFCWDLDYEEC